MLEGMYLPCVVSGRTISVYPTSSLGHSRVNHSYVKIRGLKCASLKASFVCEARRNPDFSRQNRSGYSRSRNKNNEGRDGFESFEEDMLSLKNGPLVSLSASGKSQTTSAPGPREKEIVELFKKVQARLRERAANKEEKKVETSQAQSKENGTVDSLLKLLKKHSVEQVKRSSGGSRGKDHGTEQDQESSQYIRGRSNKISDLDSAPRHESQEANFSSVTRPRSNFQRRSPVPRGKYQPVSYNEDVTNVGQRSSEVGENIRDQLALKHDDEPEIDSETDIDHEPEDQPDLDPKDELFFPDIGIADMSDDDSHDHEQTEEIDHDEHTDDQLAVHHEDLSAMKLVDLRALAKSRSLKGFSKMKKVELIDLLTGN
ncbi:hypothetical protein PIB30_039150 [Stylosanthes scabra]|uniref:Rho termination factor-like N-terminal domain-containing protein n=1 Tax=Stylosanthes scabra TaxID=79078 RepID=A0ABU6UHE5_9FABA|nr:hypothetical protein [Stylosanthes scabra]